MELGFSNKQRILNLIEKLFVFYIFIQPILDLFVYINVPLSNPIRVLALLIGFIYLLFYPDKKIRIFGIGYIITLGIFMLANLINNFILKSPFYFTQELTYGVKSAYVVSMLIIYTAVFSSLKNKLKWEEIVQRGITLNLIFISIIMALATITNTGHRSYGMLAKKGHSGWFFSANEISAILALGFGILLIYILNKKSTKEKIIWTPIILIVAWSMLTIGTKVGLFALLILLIISVFISFIEWFVKKQNAVNIIILAFVLTSSVLYIPNSPVGNNLNITFSKPEASNGDVSELPKGPKNVQKPKSSVPKQALSGRDQFLKNTLEDFKEAPLSQKLLGMGPGGNYKERLKLIEMDFLDWFFAYGVIGFIILFSPIMLYLLVIIKRMFQLRFKQLNSTLFIVGLEVGLALGIALLAGHIFLNPASGIYFAILLSYLYVLAADIKQNKIITDKSK